MEEELLHEDDVLSEEAIINSQSLGNIDNSYLIYFDKSNGAILSITNEERKDFESFIKMPYEDVKLFLEGKQNFNDFKIVFEKDQITLVSSKVSTDINFNSLILVDLTDILDSSCSIENHVDVKHWAFKIRDDVKVGLKQKILDVTLEFYICKHQNKNFVFRTIPITLERLVREDRVFIPHEFDVEADKTQVSIVTKKFFDTYGLRTLNESTV
jgi:hypothetical protein